MSGAAVTALPADRDAPDWKFLSIGRTHVGCVRTLNEDAFVNRPEAGVWAVADGMGGHNSGDVASATVAAVLEKLGRFASAYALRDAATQALLAANDALVERGVQQSGETIGSTVAALLAFGGHYACLWAGDSRVYRYRAGQLQMLTRDHSFVQDLIDAGALSPERARQHPRANVITRAVGARPELELDSAYGALRDGDRFLICSDGLTGALSERDIAAEMRRAPVERVADRLIAGALARGARDNVTAVVVFAEAD